MDLNDLVVGAVVETKKKHPCGGSLWEIVGGGADRKIRCLTCGRYVVLSPDELKRRVRRMAEAKA